MPLNGNPNRILNIQELLFKNDYIYGALFFLLNTVMRQTITLLVSLFLLNNISNAQEYVRLMENQNANFYDIQKAFNEHWDGKSYEKGKGWKQFKRWEYFMEPRVYPSGRIIDPSLAYKEFNKFKSTYGAPQNSTNKKAANWTAIGPTSFSDNTSLRIGRVNVITLDPNNSNIIYIGSPAGGCWKSIDAGNSWTPLTDHLGSLGVSGIAIDPNNSNTVYIATGDGDGNDTYSIGIMKSADGGATWNSTGLNWNTTQNRQTRKIIIDPNNSNILFVVTTSGIFKTTDAGATWTNLITGNFRDIEFNPANSNTIFACTNTAFYKSTNGGNSFNFISSGTPASGVGRLTLAVTANDTNYVYLLATNSSDNGFKGIYRSTDAGDSFVLRANSPNVLGWSQAGNDSGGQGWYDLALEASPTNRNEIYTGGVNMWKSTNGGASLYAITNWWNVSGSIGFVHADIHSIDYYGNTLYCGSDGGIFRSTNNGTSWTDLTNGMQISQYYRLGASAIDAGTILAGAQDNGTTLLKNNVWTHPKGGDGMECIADWSNTNIMYASSQNGSIAKSTDGGNSFNTISNSIGQAGAWVTPYTQDPINSNTIYIGYNDVWKSTNGGNTWNTISSFSAPLLKSLVVAPSNNNVIYAANDNSIKKTTNGGGTWTDITTGLPANAITYISVHNLNPSILWVSLSGFNNGQKVYKSINGGATWTNVSGNLPNLPINCITYEYGTNNGIYVGTDVGIYYKNDDLNLWQLYNDNLPNVIVYELEIHYGSGKIRAATYGRGLWESSLFVTAPPTAQFLSPDTNICPNNCAQFTNTTPNLGLQWKWYFPGGTPSTSTDLNPLVCYPTTGNYDVSLTVSNPAGSDSVHVSNYVLVQSQLTGTPPPLNEGFESSSVIPSNWKIINDDNGIQWEHNNSVGAYGLSSSCIFLDNFSTNFRGEKDLITSQLLDFSNLTNSKMTFDYAYRQWSPAKNDTLTIYYSLDCGLTKSILWQKGGADLATTNYLPLYFTPSSTEWKSDTIDLSLLASQSSVGIYFENSSDNGNVLYIDNINIHDSLSVNIQENVKEEDISVYPNPFTNKITIKQTAMNIKTIEVYNSIGALVFKESETIKTNTHTISLNDFKSGFYLIKIETENSRITKSLIKH